MARSPMEARMVESIEEHAPDLADLCRFIAQSDEEPIIHEDSAVSFSDEEVMIVGVACYLYSIHKRRRTWWKPSTWRA